LNVPGIKLSLYRLLSTDIAIRSYDDGFPSPKLKLDSASPNTKFLNCPKLILVGVFPGIREFIGAEPDPSLLP